MGPRTALTAVPALCLASFFGVEPVVAQPLSDRVLDKVQTKAETNAAEVPNAVYLNVPTHTAHDDLITEAVVPPQA
ncbi:MAG: hypothetical protein AAFX45_01295 [Pseudomonadota bacterium]